MQPHGKSKQLGELIKQRQIMKQGGRADQAADQHLQSYLQEEESFNKLMRQRVNKRGLQPSPEQQLASTYSTANLDESMLCILKDEILNNTKLNPVNEVVVDAIQTNKDFAASQLLSLSKQSKAQLKKERDSQ